MTEPFGPLVVRSPRGILHRAQPGPELHARCAGGRPFRGEVLTPAEAVAWAKGRPAVLCRYPWCFRAVLEAAGEDVQVGHVARYLARPVRPMALTPHRPDVGRLLKEPGRAVCVCGRQLVHRHGGRSGWAHVPVAAA